LLKHSGNPATGGAAGSIITVCNKITGSFLSRIDPWRAFFNAEFRLTDRKNVVFFVVCLFENNNFKIIYE